MNPFDLPLIEFINQFAGRSAAVDSTIFFISENHLLKGGVLLTLLWWAWFKADERQSHVQKHLIATLISCFITIVFARGLAWSLPFRFRPLHEASLGFTLPLGMTETLLDGWSAFPSDHAALFYALSAGMLYISKKVGVFALLYTTLLIGLPRVYVGLHYPTDIIAGAVIGVLISVVCNKTGPMVRLSSRLLHWSRTKPELFYPIFFIITYQVADMFNHSRAFGGFLQSLIRRAYE